MGDNWDDSDDDDWDKSDDDDDELDKRLGLKKLAVGGAVPAFDDEEDMAVKEKEAAAKASNSALKTKGKALADKKRLEAERKEELEVARKAMALEAEMEADMDDEERRARERERIEEDAKAQADDLFGGVDAMSSANGGPGGGGVGGKAMEAGDTVKMKDLKDHLKHARKVAQCMKGHGKVHLATAFLKELLQESKDVLDDDAITDLIKTMNVIKNEKVQESKRKVKGQAQKSKKKDKTVVAKAQKIQNELYGDSNQHDDYDEYGAQYEDDFF